MNKLLGMLIFCLSACGGVSIKGSFQGLYSYYHQTNAINPRLFVKDNQAMCGATGLPPDSMKIVIRTGLSLKNCIKDYDKAVVYLWGPRCTSKICPSLDILQRKCREKGLELFIVAEYYDNTLMTKQYAIERPISGIDTKYYRTNLTAKYTTRFLSDLTGNKSFDRAYHRLIYFEKGHFVRTAREIHEL